MSATLMGAVFYLDLPAPEKLLLLAMADHANDDGHGIYPGNDRLALKTSTVKRTVQRHLAELEETHKLISRERHAHGGRGYAVEWSIDTAKVYTLAEANGWAQKQRVSRTSPFDHQKGDTGDLKGDISRAKGRHPRHPNHQEPSEPRDSSQNPSPPRNDPATCDHGEGRKIDDDGWCAGCSSQIREAAS